VPIGGEHMGRPRKIENSRSRSFLLPSGLLERLGEAAKLQGKEVSEVVREILERHIGEYLQALLLAKSRSLWQAIRGDPILKELFEKHRGRKNLVVPLDTGLSRDQVMLLVEALEARPELEELAAQSPPGPAADGVDPKLEELAKRFPPKTADRVRRLGELLAGGNI